MGNPYKLIVAGNKLEGEFLQYEAPVVFIKELFKKNGFNELKRRIYDCYVNKAFMENEKGEVRYNDQTYDLSQRCWGGEDFWIFRVIACCNMEDIQKNIDSIVCYADFEKYKNEQFDIIPLFQPDSEYQERAVKIIRKRFGEHKKKDK